MQARVISVRNHTFEGSLRALFIFWSSSGLLQFIIHCGLVLCPVHFCLSYCNGKRSAISTNEFIAVAKIMQFVGKELWTVKMMLQKCLMHTALRTVSLKESLH